MGKTMKNYVEHQEKRAITFWNEIESRRQKSNYFYKQRINKTLNVLKPRDKKLLLDAGG